MRKNCRNWKNAVIALLAATVSLNAWAADSSSMTTTSLPRLVTPYKDSAAEPSRQRERSVAPGDFRPMVTEAPGVTARHAPQPRPSTVPNAALTPAKPEVVPLKIAPPLVKKLPGRLMTPPLVVTGDAASLARLPAAVTTAALVVTGAAESVPTLPAAINTPALAVTGVADLPPALPSSIATPGLTVTGEAP